MLIDAKGSQNKKVQPTCWKRRRFALRLPASG